MKARVFLVLSVCLFLSGALLYRVQEQPTGAGRRRNVVPTKTAGPEVTRNQVLSAYGKFPLTFEANQGQTDGEVKFLSRGSGYTLFLTPTEAVMALEQRWPSAEKHSSGREMPGKKTTSVLRVKLLGANPDSQAEGIAELPGKSNYFIGNDPENWYTDVPSYARVKYRDVYPGVDLVYYGNQRQLENDFIVKPGARPAAILLGFQAEDKIKIDPQGDLIVANNQGQTLLRKPHIYQEAGGSRQEVPGRYVLRGQDRVGFEVGAYDGTRPLVIDPVLVYSTYLGGSFSDEGLGIAVDAAGNAYVTGITASTDFPTTANAFRKTFGGGANNLFVTKFNPAGSALLYSTYLGGNGDDMDESIAVDSSGNIYVTGSTSSTNFPLKNAYQSSYQGGSMDAFVTKLNPSLSGSAQLVYSTYLGGSLDDNGEGIAVDSAGNIYIIGDTGSSNFPIFPNPGAYQTTYGGGPHDAFVAKLNPNLSGTASLVYSTFFGGLANDEGEGIVLGSANIVYVTGVTASANFPTTAGAFQTSYGGGLRDAFVAKLDLSKAPSTALIYSTYLGGSGDDSGRALALDAAGNVYVTGLTSSTNFPTTTGALQTTYRGGPNDAFVSKLNTAGTAQLYSTYLGGSGDDQANGIALDGAGNAYVIGTTASADFPATAGALGASFGGGAHDVFVTKLNAGGSALVYSTYLGGSDDDFGYSVAVDAAGNAYVTGTTASVDFPTASPLRASNAGGIDAFVAKLTNLSDLTISVSPPSVTVNRGQAATYTVTVAAQGGAFNDPVSLSCANLPARTSCSFSSPSVTPGANPATSTMTISTTAGSAVFRVPDGWQKPLPILLVCFGLATVALLWAGCRTNPPRKVALGYCCLPLVVLLAALTVACGGGGSSGSSNNPPPASGTAPGTYTLTVRGASGSIQRSTTATLVVQ